MRFAAQLSERSVHRAGGGVSHVGEYVRVDVEGKAYVPLGPGLCRMLQVDFREDPFHALG